MNVHSSFIENHQKLETKCLSTGGGINNGLLLRIKKEPTHSNRDKSQRNCAK
jgi:hypothetical protein